MNQRISAIIAEEKRMARAREKYVYSLLTFSSNNIKCKRNDCMYHAGPSCYNGCDYILCTGERRGCKGGDGCKRYKPGKRQPTTNEWGWQGE